MPYNHRECWRKSCLKACYVRRVYLSSDSYHSESKVKQGAQSVALGKLWDNFNHVMLPMSRLDALQTALVKVRGPP